jgi:outer membrane biosynthesis protein TonB
VFDWHSSTQSACVANSNPPEHAASPALSSSANAAGAALAMGVSDSESGLSTTRRTFVKEIVGMRPAFRTCYRNLLARDPLAEGTVRLSFAIDCLGSVTSIHAVAHGVDRETVYCLFTRIAQSRFSPPEGGSARVEMPVVFVREPATKTD